MILQRGYVLLCQNRKRGYFYLPGGHVEFGESAAEAVARELMEEAGKRIKVGLCVWVDEHVFTQKRKRRHEVNMLFGAVLAGPAPVRSGEAPAPVPSRESAIAFNWVPVRKLGGLDLRPPHHAVAILQHARQPGQRANAFAFRAGR